MSYTRSRRQGLSHTGAHANRVENRGRKKRKRSKRPVTGKTRWTGSGHDDSGGGGGADLNTKHKEVPTENTRKIKKHPEKKKCRARTQQRWIYYPTRSFSLSWTLRVCVVGCERGECSVRKRGRGQEGGAGEVECAPCMEAFKKSRSCARCGQRKRRGRGGRPEQAVIVGTDSSACETRTGRRPLLQVPTSRLMLAQT